MDTDNSLSLVDMDLDLNIGGNERKFNQIDLNSNLPLDQKIDLTEDSKFAARDLEAGNSANAQVSSEDFAEKADPSRYYNGTMDEPIYVTLVITN